MECLGKKKKGEQLVTSIAQVTLSYKMKSLESKGYRGNTFFLLPTKHLYPSSPEVFRTMYSHV